MFDWTPKFVSVDRVTVDDDGKVDTVPVLSVEGFPLAGEAFIDLVDHQLRKFVSTKPDTGVSSPCKVFSFIDNEKGQADRSWLEEEMLGAETLKEFTEAAGATNAELVNLPGVSPGILVQAVVKATLEDDTMMDLVFITLLSYLPTEKLIFGDEVDLEEVTEVVHRDPSKAILYPFGTPQEIRYELVKILSRPVTNCWQALLSVSPPPSTERLLQDEVAKAVQALEPGKWDERKELFRRIPPKKRMLLGEERLVPPALTLEPAMAAAVARQCCRTSKDLYDKNQVLVLDLGGAKVTLPVEFLGERFAFYRHQGEEVLMIRAKSIMTTRGGMGPADFIEPQVLHLPEDESSD